MIIAIFAMFLIMGLVAIFASYTMVGGIILIILICALVALGVYRIRRFKFD